MKIKKNIARNDLIISAILKGFEEKKCKDKRLFLLVIVVGMTLGAKSKPHLSD